MKMYVAINIFYIFANPAQCVLGAWGVLRWDE